MSGTIELRIPVAPEAIGPLLEGDGPFERVQLVDRGDGTHDLVFTRAERSEPDELESLMAAGHTIETDIVGCARCHGEGHDGLRFRPLTHPLELDAEAPLTHWAPCPANGEPILLRVTSSEPPQRGGVAGGGSPDQ
jgi:hypothetical protein